MSTMTPLLLCLVVAVAAEPKVQRREGHFYGPNMTVASDMRAIGSINVQG